MHPVLQNKTAFHICLDVHGAISLRLSNKSSIEVKYRLVGASDAVS